MHIGRITVAFILVALPFICHGEETSVTSADIEPGQPGVATLVFSDKFHEMNGSTLYGRVEPNVCPDEKSQFSHLSLHYDESKEIKLEAGKEYGFSFSASSPSYACKVYAVFTPIADTTYEASILGISDSWDQKKRELFGIPASAQGCYISFYAHADAGKGKTTSANTNTSFRQSNYSITPKCKSQAEE